MFWALAAEKIDTGNRRYVHELSDIESLNQRALKGELEITAVSFHAYAHLSETYALLPHGGSLGDGYGPRLVAKGTRPANVEGAIAGKRIAVPGELTTALLVLRLFQPSFESVVVPFDEIEGVVLRDEADAGLLIHEGQLTYGTHGLALWSDLGEWWSGETDGLPLPLGCNVVRRDLGEQLIPLVSHDLRNSITYGLAHRQEALAHALRYARGLDEADADTFVGMYVNDYTVDYGETGRRAVQVLLDRAADAGLVPSRVTATFVDDTGIEPSS